jgi:hypothetical protein
MVIGAALKPSLLAHISRKSASNHKTKSANDAGSGQTLKSRPQNATSALPAESGHHAAAVPTAEIAPGQFMATTAVEH